PGPVFFTVKTGTLTVYEGEDPSCTPLVFPAGTGAVGPQRAPTSTWCATKPTASPRRWSPTWCRSARSRASCGPIFRTQETARSERLWLGTVGASQPRRDPGGLRQLRSPAGSGEDEGIQVLFVGLPHPGGQMSRTDSAIDGVSTQSAAGQSRPFYQ